jgi:phospholipid/cholesterol/gamma-HCH transport system permease protein
MRALDLAVVWPVPAAASATVVPLKGDLVRGRTRGLYRDLRRVVGRRDARPVVLDFAEAGRIDSAGLALISLLKRHLENDGRSLELRNVAEHHQAALALLPETEPEPADTSKPVEERPGALEKLGGDVIDLYDGSRSMFGLVAGVVRQGIAVITRRERMPDGELVYQLSKMGVNAIFIVGLLSFLLGMTMAFQGAVQLQKFGAGPFVADMVSLTMVREIAPLMTAVILTGRTGAAIAAELGTMVVRSEIDALATMGISPTRYLVLPRLVSISIIGPALSLMSMFIGIAGGMLVTAWSLDLPPGMFWQRTVDRLMLGDFVHGLVKSVLFAWIIGLAGSHLGMSASGDASSVGRATTRTVVASVFCIIVVDAIFATVTLIWRQH